MEEIVTSVKRVTDIIGEISAASQEQSGGIEQVNTAVSQMDKITQQNAALVEEAAAAAKSMEEQTNTLAEMVSVFTLQESQITHHAQPTRSAMPPAGASRKPKPTSMSPLRNGRLAKSEGAVKPITKPRSATSNGTGTDSDWQEF